MLPPQYITSSLGLDIMSYIDIPGIAPRWVVYQEYLCSDFSRHQNHLKGWFKPRLLGPTHGFWFSRFGVGVGFAGGKAAQESAFLTNSHACCWF